MNLVGETMGNYQIVAEIGRGGMGVVYRGFQVSLGRYVAVTVLPPQFIFDEMFVQRFQGQTSDGCAVPTTPISSKTMKRSFCLRASRSASALAASRLPCVTVTWVGSLARQMMYWDGNCEDMGRSFPLSLS